MMIHVVRYVPYFISGVAAMIADFLSARSDGKEMHQHSRQREYWHGLQLARFQCSSAGGSMPVINLETRILAPPERVFDLARSIDAHMASAGHTRERAVAGKVSGLIGLDETVTWEAWHLGFTRRLTVKITAYDRPRSFTDEMTRGAFAFMRHVHRFTADGDATLMTDEFHFAAPFGPLGRIAEHLFLTRYMRRFLEIRNQELKRLAEIG